MKKDHIVSLLNQQVACVVELMDKGKLEDDIATLFASKPITFTEADAFFARLDKANRYYKKMISLDHPQLDSFEKLAFKMWLRELTLALDRLVELKGEALKTIYSTDIRGMN